MLAQVALLLAFIRKHESRGDYDVVWHGIRAQDRPNRPLTDMTVREVLAWQDSIDRLYASEAAGAYQILEDTLRDILKGSGVALDDPFNELTQDRLALVLLKRRGLDAFLAGRISCAAFGQNLSREWASLPCTIADAKGRPARGQSYYDGDGLNVSGSSLASFLSVLNQTLKASAVAAVPVRKPDAFEAISDFFRSLFSNKG